MLIHDLCVKGHDPAPQCQALVYAEGLKSITDFHPQSLFYTSKLLAGLAPPQTLPHLCSLGFVTGSSLFAFGLHGALCEGAFHTCPQCHLSGLMTVNINRWEKEQGAAITKGVQILCWLSLVW